MADFLGVPDAKVIQLRTPIANAMAFAIGDVTRPFTHDDSVSPVELVAAMIDAHALGLAGAVNASRHDADTPADVAELAIERFRHHLSKGASRG